MEIAHWNTEEQTAQEGQDGIAEIAVQERHGARLDAAAEAVAHDQLIARAQAVDHGIQVLEIVAVVASPMMTKRPRAAPMPPISAAP